jgi:hypothetical protein
MPLVSTLNALDGQIHNNAAIVPAGTDGAINIYVTHPANVILDINGYYAAIGDANGNTSLGVGALPLQSNTGRYNTALGDAAMAANTTGSANTANGYQALQNNDYGADNTASGIGALGLNTDGSSNTASGAWALYSNITGSENTASGYAALYSNTGNDNLANGFEALLSNTSGAFNAATGAYALLNNSTGSSNTASGEYALWRNTTGNNNISIGYYAAANVSNGNSNNIHIGTSGSFNDNSTIRIGGNTALYDPVAQTAFFASGIRGITTGNADAIAVVIDSNGQLGTVSSSRTVKRDIEDMGDTTGAIMGLRPVRFRYKVHGPDSPEQYGLVAEEVAEVAPDLVARNKEGQIETVFYDKVNVMLLNQVQTQQRLIESQKMQLQSQRQEFTDLIGRLEWRLAELESRASEK